MKNVVASGSVSHSVLTSRRKRSAAPVLFELFEPRMLLSAYYVSPVGSDAGAGTAAAPWQTLQHAADVVQAGDYVDVQAGTYVGFNLTSSHSGTASSPITFHAEAGVVINTGNTKTGDGINMEGASYITIDGFTVNNAARGGIRAVTDTNVTIKNNHVNAANQWNIFTGFSQNVVIENNVSTNPVNQHDIYVSNSADNPIIRNNTCSGSQGCGIHMNGDISQGGDGIISNALVEGNIIYNNGSLGGSGINADGVQNSVFRNNVVYGELGSGLSLFQQDGGGPSTGNLVINNTIVVASTGRWAINITNGSTNNTVRNNILDNLNTGHGAISVTSDSMSGFTSDDNVIINNKFTDGSTNYTLAQWQSFSGQDLNSIVSTEGSVFVNAGANNYHLAAGSPAIDKGTSVNAPSTDLDGNPRPSGAGYDIGAYEYQNGSPAPAPAPTPAASSSTLNLSSGSVTSGQAVTLTASVTSASGTPTGSISFMDGSSLVGTATLSGGSASYSCSNLATGTHALTAKYAGSTSYAACTSAAATLSVTPAPAPTPSATNSTLKLSSSSITSGQSVTLTATIASASGIPTGTVSFMDGTALLGSVALTNGSASVSTSSLATGTHSLTAKYTGSASYAASTSPAVAISVAAAPAPAPTPAATTSSLKLSSNSVVSGQTVALTITVTSASGTPTGTVNFMDGTALIGSATLSGGSASISTSALATGTHSLTAKYTGSTSFAASTSPAVALSVTAPTPVPTPTPTPTPTGNLFTADGDIGSPALKGSASYDTAVGMYTITGAGKDIWGSTDQFHFDYKTQPGDAVIVARVNGVVKTYGWAKAGVMFRSDTTAGSQFVDLLVTPSNGVAFQWRSASGGLSSNAAVAGIKAPEWVKLVRSGNSFSGFYSSDGVTWTQVGAAVTVNMNPNALAGLAVTSHNASALTTATFSGVSVLSSTQAAPLSTQISLGYNAVGASNDGATFVASTGIDVGGLAYSAAQLGTSIAADGMTFTLGTSSLNALRTAGQTLTLPAGNFSKLVFLGNATYGNQVGAFTVTYTDGTTQTLTQSFSDWWSPTANFANETVAKSSSYLNLAGGGQMSQAVQLFAYTNTLNIGKTVASLTLPANANIDLLAIGLVA